MPSALLLRICLLNSASHALFDDNKNDNISRIVRTIYVRKPSHSSAHSWRTRHRRANFAATSPFRRRQRPSQASSSHSLQSLGDIQNQSLVWSNTAARRRTSVDRSSVEQITAPSSPETDHSVSCGPRTPVRKPHPRRSSQHTGEMPDLEPMSPPTPSETFETRSTRSTSSASRNTNRLSLTLPIAPPNSGPSRPTPASATVPSFPPTPSDTSSVASPSDTNEFIVAIAAQERRVLELREELKRAEGELVVLKRQWGTHEARKKQAEIRNPEPARPLIPGLESVDDGTPEKRELDRRKALLLSKHIPKEHRRRVFSGAHTRALSLVSPAKPSDGFAIHQDPDCLKSPESYTRPVAPIPSHLSKRASWTPRQYQQQHGVKQIAEDFRTGLWTFVEDLRQATVGDEAITGTTHRTSDLLASRARLAGDQDTIRASTANRPKIPSLMDFEPFAGTPSKPPSTSASQDRPQHQRSGSKAEAKTRKHFSWTPLTADNFDDDDWSNWDSPTVKTSRWSGSTVNGDIIPIPEKNDENRSPLRESSPEEQSGSPQTPSKLEEVAWPALNRLSLTSGVIKDSASKFMKDWEKSLSPPPTEVTFNDRTM